MKVVCRLVGRLLFFISVVVVDLLTIIIIGEPSKVYLVGRATYIVSLHYSGGMV